LTTSPERFRRLHLPVCSSTNDHIRRNIARLEADFPLMVSADVQTAGRGRDNRAWNSPANLGIYATFGFMLPERRALSLLSILCGVALADMLESWTGVTFALKWPNDLLAAGRKVAGILCETIVKADQVVCLAGIGVNVNQERGDFPGDLSDRAGSLKMLTGREWPLADGRERLAASMAFWLQKLRHDERAAVIGRARQLSRPFLGRPIRFHHQGRDAQGVFVNIADDGGLRLQLPGGGEQTFYSGDFIAQGSA
jgi:BirA family biotin operon repressor/biotin-[acetyl-CoA-carboxylase] ligase